MADATYSTKELSALLGVSVSSVKRWTDEGLIPCLRTPGGHRKFRESDIRDFAAKAGIALSSDKQPPPVKIPEGEAGAKALLTHPESLPETFKNYLLSGNEENSLRLLVNAYNSGIAFVRLVDDIIAPALHDIGCGWEEGKITIHEEHLASTTAANVVSRLIERISPVAFKSHGGVAVCACGEGEDHVLCIILVGYLLRSKGWSVKVLGGNTPYKEISDCVTKSHPNICLLSSSSLDNAMKYEGDLSALADICRTENVKLILGGRGFTEEFLRKVKADILVQRFSDLLPVLEACRPRKRGRPRKIQMANSRQIENDIQ